MFGKLCICILGALALEADAQPFTAIYGFPNVTSSSGTASPGPHPNVIGLTFNSFTAAGVSDQPTAAGRFSFDGWGLGAVHGSDDYPLFTGSLDPFRYYEAQIDVTPGYTLQLNAMSFTVRRSTTGVRHFCIRVSDDNFTANLSATTGDNHNLSVVEDNVFFWNYDSLTSTSEQNGCEVSFAPRHQKITGHIRVRFYAWNAESSGGNFSIDNVEFSGSVKDSTLFMGLENADQIGTGVPVTYSLYNTLGSPISSSISREELFREDRAEGLYLLQVRKDGVSRFEKILVRYRDY